MAVRSDAELREQSLHVLWEFRMLMRLATHLYDRRHEGVTQTVEPLDAAALESFCLHARALMEFLWRDRTRGKKPRKDDAVAGDWFDSGTWRYEPILPAELHVLEGRVGVGMAHIRYKRIDLIEAWGWHHVEIAHRIAYRFACFVQDVPRDRVDRHFEHEAATENLGFRQNMADKEPWVLAPAAEPVGTPAYASLWIAPLDPT